tara:strand:+ start:185 stop:1951 length:1767 start_codon:yes stop_codon:yes gene_type:complete
MYKKIFADRKAKGLRKNQHLIHLWTDEGYEAKVWDNVAYVECDRDNHVARGLNGEYLKRIQNWTYIANKDSPYRHNNTPNLHWHDIPAHQKFLIEKYGIDDTPSTTHKELFFDIECEMGDALTVDYIKSAPKRITSIAWYDKQAKEGKPKWGIVILDEKNQLEHTISKNGREIIPCKDEKSLLMSFGERFRSIDPDVIIGWNSDYFDIPYLYYRMCNVLGSDIADYILSPIGIVRETPWFNNRRNGGQYLQIAGVESLDYMCLHKKYSWADEPSMRLDAIGEKYVGMNKIEYEGNLDDLFKSDISKFIKYNFVDVEILKLLDEKLGYLSLTYNLAHKGKHNYQEVYANTRTQDGAISAYLLSKEIIPPPKDENPIVKKGYAGGYLFCPKAGLYNYMFDEDLTSLYPSIIMTVNIGKETMTARIIDADDRNNRLGLNDLKSLDSKEELLIENPKRVRTKVTVEDLIEIIEERKFAISANGVMFKTDRESVLSTILKKWFDERVLYKGKMQKAFKSGDKELGASYHMKQYTMKILLNSLYGATALGSFRYGNVVLSEAITLSGQRIIQESALCANRHMNKIIKNNNNETN